jgi:hypothetical protein
VEPVPAKAGADDFVILCASEAEAQAALCQITAWVTANGLTLHPDKTKVGDCQQPGQGFDFLGYRFEAGVRFVRDKSLKAFKDKLRTRTIRSRGDSIERIVADINPMLRGWFEYFKHARPRLFRKRLVRHAVSWRDICQSHRSSGVALIQPLTNPVQVPRQEFMHAFDRMIGDAFEDLAQIVLGIETVQLRRLC